jgi:hypothetical protein
MPFGSRRTEPTDARANKLMSPRNPALVGPARTSPSCADHPCDNCYLCRRRRCCRQDRPDFPKFGDWTEPIFGEFGLLAVAEDEMVVCHVCGKAYHSLDHHVRQAHDLWPEEYRVLFGLERGHALESATLRARPRELADNILRPWRERIRDVVARTTPEERAARSRGKTRRLETLRNPTNQAHWAEALERTQATRRTRLRSGELRLPPGFGNPAVARAALRKAQARRQNLLQDPAYRELLGERMRAAKAARESVTCTVCDRPFTSPRSWLRRGYGKICSPACREIWKLQRGHGRDGLPWEQVTARLQALGPAALDALPPPAPEIVRCFYGLIDGKPWTQRAIAEHLGLPKSQVQRILTGPAVSRMLGEPGHRPDRQRTLVACAICGTAVERAPRELRDRVQTTCGPECRLELQRRQVTRLTGDAATRARRLDHLRQKATSSEFREQVRQRALQRSRPHANALRALASEAFDRLPARDSDLVRRYYGLDGEPQTLAELARDIRYSERRVRNILNEAVAQLLQPPPGA